MGIAQRQIRVKFKQKPTRKHSANPLSDNIKTIGDWIKVKRMEKNLTSGHVAAKMGIAQTLVRSWEGGESQPNSQQLRLLVNLFGSDPKKQATFAVLLLPSQPGTKPSVRQPVVQTQPILPEDTGT